MSIECPVAKMMFLAFLVPFNELVCSDSMDLFSSHTGAPMVTDAANTSGVRCPDFRDIGV